MTLGDLRLGMPLNLDDQAVISKYRIKNIRNGVSNGGRAFRQFSFGPSRFDTEDGHIFEGVEVDGLVDCLIKSWMLPYQTEGELQEVFHGLSAMFGELYNKHLQELSKRTKFITQIYSPDMEIGVKAYPKNMAMAVQAALMSCLQLGRRIMARVIFCEADDLNTSYTLELCPAESKFQLSELITLRNQG